MWEKRRVLNKLKYLFSIMLILSILLDKSFCELDFGNDEQNQKNFKSVPTTVKTFENDTVLLPCDTRSPFRYVRWHRDEVLLVDSRYPEMSTDSRIYLWTNGSLQVTHLQAKDTGDYYCEIYINDNNHVVQVHAIEVQYEPILVSDPSGVVELPLGATFEMVCGAVGIPQPVITWRHNGKTLNTQYATGNRQSQLFDINSREMSGTIQCMATNGVGRTAIGEVLLNVLFPPEISAESVVYTKIGQKASLECIVEADPAARVQWYHHGITVTSDQWYQMVTNYENDAEASIQRYFAVLKHVLVVRKVRESDLGLYECRAENNYGFKSINIELTGRPNISKFKINPGPQSLTAHELVWVTESLSPIMEYKLKFRQISDWTELTIPSELSAGAIYTKSYTLRGLQPASVFEVTVLARNHFGWSDNSKIVRFATGGEVEVPNYSTESEMQYDDGGENSVDKHIKSEDHLNEITPSNGNKSFFNSLAYWLMLSLFLQILF